MIGFGNEREDVNSIMAPFLIESNEDADNCVRFVVSLVYENERKPDVDDAGLAEVLSNKNLLYPDEKQIYEITFENYILYQIRNESYCSWDEYEIRKGNHFIVFERSRLLDWLPQMTDCQACAGAHAYPGEWEHYGIYCQNHIIDIISHNKPVIRKLEKKQ